MPDVRPEVMAAFERALIDHAPIFEALEADARGELRWCDCGARIVNKYDEKCTRCYILEAAEDERG